MELAASLLLLTFGAISLVIYSVPFRTLEQRLGVSSGFSDLRPDEQTHEA